MAHLRALLDWPVIGLCAALAIATLDTGVSLAEEPLRCRTTQSDNWCVPIIACFGEGGTWFKGEAFGRRSGAIRGVLSNGAVCNGHWARSADNLSGDVTIDCADGRSAAITFAYVHPGSGTVIAKGETNRGEPVTAWSGQYVPNYLRDVAGMPEGKLVCGKNILAIS